MVRDECHPSSFLDACSESAKVSVGCSEASNANKVEESAPALTNDIALNHSPEKEYVGETT